MVTNSAPTVYCRTSKTLLELLIDWAVLLLTETFVLLLLLTDCAVLVLLLLTDCAVLLVEAELLSDC